MMVDLDKKEIEILKKGLSVIPCVFESGFREEILRLDLWEKLNNA